MNEWNFSYRCLSENKFKQVSGETGYCQNPLNSQPKGDKGAVALSGENTLKSFISGQNIYRQKKMVPSSVSEALELSGSSRHWPFPGAADSCHSEVTAQWFKKMAQITRSFSSAGRDVKASARVSAVVKMTIGHWSWQKEKFLFMKQNSTIIVSETAGSHSLHLTRERIAGA